MPMPDGACGSSPGGRHVPIRPGREPEEANARRADRSGTPARPRPRWTARIARMAVITNLITRERNGSRGMGQEASVLAEGAMAAVSDPRTEVQQARFQPLRGIV